MENTTEQGNAALREHLSKLRSQLPAAPAGYLTSTMVAERLNATEREVLEKFGPTFDKSRPDSLGRPIISEADFNTTVAALAAGKSPGAAAGFLVDGDDSNRIIVGPP